MSKIISEDLTIGSRLARQFKNARQRAQKYFPSEAKANCETEVKCRPKAKPSCKKVTKTTKDGKELRLGDPDTRIIIGDCRDVLPTIRAEGIDTIFADQPYNIGVEYDTWNDNLSKEQFWKFTYDWIDLCVTALSPRGSFFLWLPPRLANRAAVHIEDRGLTLINDIVVVQRFGQHKDSGFISGHVRLLYFSKDKDRRTWNPSDILVPSLRATKYKDKRTEQTKNPGKRVPLDVWGIDEKYFGRVSGVSSNKERRDGHPNQVPEVVVKRALLATTNPGDLVLDPFLGSGTTSTVARALGRRSIGIEISRKYAESAFERIKAGAVRV